MASLTLINNNTKLALSSDAHMPHYLGKATYVGTTQVPAEGTSNKTTMLAFVYQINSTYAPLAFVQLTTGTAYSVRQVYQYSTGVWRVAISTTGLATDTPPNVFCFGRISTAKTGGPALRLFDSSGVLAFDSQSMPLRIAARPEFAAISGAYDTGVTSQPLPAGMVQPAICTECAGYKTVCVKVGSYWNYTLYAYDWYLDGANLKRGPYYLGLDSREDGGTVGATSYLHYAKPVVIETYGLP